MQARLGAPGASSSRTHGPETGPPEVRWGGWGGDAPRMLPSPLRPVGPGASHTDLFDKTPGDTSYLENSTVEICQERQNHGAGLDSRRGGGPSPTQSQVQRGAWQLPSSPLLLHLD